MKKVVDIIGILEVVSSYKEINWNNHSTHDTEKRTIKHYEVKSFIDGELVHTSEAIIDESKLISTVELLEFGLKEMIKRKNQSTKPCLEHKLKSMGFE